MGTKSDWGFPEVGQTWLCSLRLGIQRVGCGLVQYVYQADHPFRPNEVGQSNLDPGYAAQLWKQYLEPLRKQGYKLGSPSMSSRPNGQKWMSDFLKDCQGGCTVILHYIKPNGLRLTRFLSVRFLDNSFLRQHF